MTETIHLFEAFGKVLVLRFEFYFGKVIYEGMRRIHHSWIISYDHGMNENLLKILAFLTGAVISVMVVFNTLLGAATTNEVSITVNQIVGIVLLSVIMLVFRNNRIVNPVRKKAPWYLWGGGLLGLIVISCNYFSVLGAGTTISMAAAVFGQCLMGVVFDMTGLMGMQKRKITGRKIISLCISLLGILTMFVFSPDPVPFFYALIGTIAGVITMIQMVYNSLFASLKGAFFSARQNVISGLAGILLFSFIFLPGTTIGGWKNIVDVSFPIIVSGGALAVFVVISANVLIPKIPGATSSILMSSGQVISAVILDYFMLGYFNPALLAGALIMILGLVISGR